MKKIDCCEQFEKTAPLVMTSTTILARLLARTVRENADLREVFPTGTSFSFCREFARCLSIGTRQKACDSDAFMKPNERKGGNQGKRVIGPFATNLLFYLSDVQLRAKDNADANCVKKGQRRQNCFQKHIKDGINYRRPGCGNKKSEN